MSEEKNRYSINYAPTHGTKNGYDWHRRGMKEEACTPCRDAMKAYWVHERTIKERSRGLRAIHDGAKRSPYTTKQAIELYGSDCHICKQSISMDAPRRVGLEGWEKGLHLDHVIPISKGGDDTIDNIRPSHGYCNIIKWAKTEWEQQ